MSSNWFSDGKNQWLARTLWDAAKDLPEEEVSIEKLLEQEEMKRYLDAELDYPIILAPDGHITDGWHRILKAWALGHKTVKVKKLAYMPLPDGGPGAKKMRASHDQLAKEVEDWESGKIKPTDPDWKDAPEAATPQAPICEDLVDVDLELMQEGHPPRMSKDAYERLIRDRLAKGMRR